MDKDKTVSTMYKVMERTLDLVQVVVPPEQWGVVRSKILRIHNDGIREIEKFNNGEKEPY